MHTMEELWVCAQYLMQEEEVEVGVVAQKPWPAEWPL